MFISTEMWRRGLQEVLYLGTFYATVFQMVLACAQMGSYCIFELSVTKYIIMKISANL
jgi:hypothetical protein